MGQTPNPASPSPTTTEELEEDLVDLPGFAAPPPPRTPDPLDPDATTISPPNDPDLGAADSWAGEQQEEEPRRASAATSTASSKASTDWRDLLPIAGTLVGMTSMLVRWLRSRRRTLPDGVWIADEDDAAAIAAPLARIAARHSPISGEGSADMVDALEVLVGTTGYAMKNLEREALASGWTPDPDPAP